MCDGEIKNTKKYIKILNKIHQIFWKNLKKYIKIHQPNNTKKDHEIIIITQLTMYLNFSIILRYFLEFSHVLFHILLHMGFEMWEQMESSSGKQSYFVFDFKKNI